MLEWGTLRFTRLFYTIDVLLYKPEPNRVCDGCFGPSQVANSNVLHVEVSRRGVAGVLCESYDISSNLSPPSGSSRSFYEKSCVQFWESAPTALGSILDCERVVLSRKAVGGVHVPHAGQFLQNGDEARRWQGLVKAFVDGTGSEVAVSLAWFSLYFQIWLQGQPNLSLRF